MLAKIEQLLQEIEGLHAANAEELEALRIKYLSKKGAINELMADFRNVPADQKKEVGMKLNELKNKAQERISTLKEAFETQDNGAAEMDLTRTAYPIELGTRHPLSIVKNEGHSLTAKYWDFFIDICSDKYNTALNKDGAKANESIWEVEFAGNRSTDVRAEGRIGNIIGIQGKDLSSKASITGKGDPGYAYAFIWNTPKLLELYEANDDIDRCNWNIAPFTYTQSAGEGTPVDGREFVKGKRDEVEQQYWDKSFSYGKTEPGSTYGDRESKNDANKNRNRAAAKYRREYEADKKSKNDTSINFPLLRYSDILLMIAEAENEVNHGPNDLAYECINAVRERAGIKKLAANLDEESFRKAIKDERAMELCFEYTRRFDLIRWGDYYKLMQEQVDKAQADESWKFGINVYTYFNIPKSYNYFPIPANEIGSNGAIKTNNPGW